ncbi:MAG: DUF1838 domain-containing protein [Alphaproteobacteria bacterium]|nr:DUF1838 domain-containing protein [Alphaproteobacteria bacterium]
MTSPISRRALNMGVAGLGGLATGIAAANSARASSDSSAQAVDPLDLKTDDGLFHNFIRIAGSTGNEVVMAWHEIYRYGIIGKDVTPLHTSRGALIVEHTNNGDGSFTMTRREVAFHCDIETGEVIDKLKNPYTGAMDDVEHLKSGPVTTVHTAHSMSQNGQVLPLQHKVGPARVVGDDVILNHDLSAKFPGPNGKLLMFYDYIQYHAKQSHLADPDLLNVPATYAIQDYIDWRAWQNMGDRDGLMPGRGFGQKVAGFDDMPDDTLAAIKERQPKFLTDWQNWEGNTLI